MPILGALTTMYSTVVSLILCLLTGSKSVRTVTHLAHSCQIIHVSLRQRRSLYVQSSKINSKSLSFCVFSHWDQCLWFSHVNFEIPPFFTKCVIFPFDCVIINICPLKWKSNHNSRKKSNHKLTIILLILSMFSLTCRLTLVYNM